MTRLRLVAFAASIVTLLSASSVAFVRSGDPATPVASRAGALADAGGGPARATKERTTAPGGAQADDRTASAGSSTRAGVVRPDEGRAHEPKRLPLSVSVRPSCLTKGQAGVAIVTTTPGAVVSATIVFPDGDVRGAWTAGQAGDDGVLRLRFVVAPDVPAGTAKASAAAVDGRERRATSTTSFRIAKIGGCGS